MRPLRLHLDGALECFDRRGQFTPSASNTEDWLARKKVTSVQLGVVMARGLYRHTCPEKANKCRDCRNPRSYAYYCYSKLFIGSEVVCLF